MPDESRGVAAWRRGGEIVYLAAASPWSQEVPSPAAVSVETDTLSARAIESEVGGIRLPAVVLQRGRVRS